MDENKTQVDGTTTQPAQAPVQATPEVAPAAPQPAAQPAPAPVQPAAPAQPAPVEAPVQPATAPVQPAPAPEAPQVEATPVSPAPEQPAAPVAPVAETPVQPVQPTAPAQPVTPVAPVEPAPVAETPAPAAPVQQPAPVAETPVQPVQEVQTPPSEQPIAPPIQPAAAIDGSAVTATTQNNGIQSSSDLGSMNNIGDISNIGFVATGEELKKKPKKLLIAIIVILVLIILGLVGYFIIYPAIVKKNTTPKRVYTETINTVFKDFSNKVTAPIHEKGIYDVNFILETNIGELEKFSGYTYGANVGIDPANKLVQYGAYINSPTGKENSFYSYFKDGNNYQRFSDYDKLVLTGSIKDNKDNPQSTEDMLNNTYHSLLDLGSRISKEDAAYLIDKVRALLVDSLDENKLYREDASIKINDENLKVLAHKYTMDKENQKRTTNFILNGIKVDEKSMDILAKLTGQDKKDIDEAIKQMMEEQPEDVSEDLRTDEEKEKDKDETIEFTIYTYGLKSEVVGYAINTKEKGNMYYYTYNGNFELYVNTETTDLETAKSKEVIYRAIGKKSDGVTNVSLVQDNKEIGTLVIRSFSDKQIDLDYTLTVPEMGQYTGTFKYNNDTNSNRAKKEAEFTLTLNEEKIRIIVTSTYDWTSEVANVNTKAAVNMTEQEILQRHGNFVKSLSDTPIGFLFETVSGPGDSSIIDYRLRNMNDPSLQVCNYLDDSGYYMSSDGTTSCYDGICNIRIGEELQVVSCNHQ